MSPEDMIEQLHIEGVSAGADFNDADHILGYFGWECDGQVLTITYEVDGKKYEHNWSISFEPGMSRESEGEGDNDCNS